MPKKKKASRRLAETLRVASVTERNVLDGIQQTASLLVVQGAEVDLGRHVLCDRPITIGRDERADLMLNDGSISRAHCSIERDAETGRYLLIDLGSTNGTAINGTRVRESAPLSAGDKIFLGASVIRFSYSDSFDVQFHSRLEEMVSTDPLTGMSSKRQYDAVYQALVERARAEESVLTVMVMDMDGLKQINDTHGHEMGSFAIAEVAALIRAELDELGHLCRFGGDEFVGCFPGVSKDRALAEAEKLRLVIDQHHFAKDGVTVKPTISIGVASYPGDQADPAQLFTAADHAMYRAKKAGKNRVAG